tara:strand:+ start:4906 stop:5157 length:252 start_codon:yes stop_codon:yes gene_type:complete
MEEIDYHKLAISLSTNKLFMRKIKNSVNYRFEEVDLNRVTRIISKLNEHIDDRLRYHDQANEIRAIIIEELPKALKMLFAEEE